MEETRRLVTNKQQEEKKRPVKKKRNRREIEAKGKGREKWERKRGEEKKRWSG